MNTGHVEVFSQQIQRFYNTWEKNIKALMDDIRFNCFSNLLIANDILDRILSMFKRTYEQFEALYTRYFRPGTFKEYVLYSTVENFCNSLVDERYDR